MNIVLTGLRGTGKTTMAKLLSKKLHMPFVDTDREIEKETGIKIHKIVEHHGWDYFRDLEHAMCKKYSGFHDYIISTGGGALSYERNSRLFMKDSIIIWLKMHVHHMIRITGNTKKRPRLTNSKTLQEEIETLVRERYPVFESIADITLHVKNPRAIKTHSDKLIKLLQRLCVPVIAGNTAEAKKKMDETYGKGALLTELRLDLCGNLDLKKIDLRRAILTPREHKFSSDIKPAFFDIEWDILNKNIVHTIKKTGAKLIASYHNFEKTPAKKDLVIIVKQFFEKGADIVKIATKINRYKDEKELLDVAHEFFQKRCIVVGMGEKSEPVRVFARAWGSLFTFASFNRDQCSAEGQLTIDDHLTHPLVTRQTKMFGIIGNPVSRSLSPLLQNTLFYKHAVNAVYLRLPCDNLRQDFEDLVKLGIQGLSVTSPFKEDIVRYVDHIDPVAKNIGAVNTLVKRGAEFFGYNTDWIGIMKTLEHFPIKKAVVLGYGGAGRATIYALRKLGVHDITVLRRKRDGQFDSFDNFEKYDYDIVINATPVDEPIDLDLLRHNKIAFDLRYTPSKFLDIAKSRQNTVVNGLSMFMHQGLEQFRLWTGKKAGIKDVEHLFPTTHKL